MYEPSCKEEADFLASYDPSKYPVTMVTVDVVVYDTERRSILLIKRGKWPFKSCWALPGGFLEQDETTMQAAVRELQEETGLSGFHLSPLGVADAPDRDPRGRTVGHVFYALGAGTAVAGDDAAEAEWVPVEEIAERSLAFDHDVWIARALMVMSANMQRSDGGMAAPAYDEMVKWWGQDPLSTEVARGTPV